MSCCLGRNIAAFKSVLRTTVFDNFIQICLIVLCLGGSLALSAQTTTTTALTLNPNPSCSGSLVTFTATVNPATATGSVDFFNLAGTNIGNAPLGVGGVATISLTLTSSTSYYAIYVGDPSHLTSTSNTVIHTVNSSPTI